MDKELRLGIRTGICLQERDIFLLAGGRELRNHGTGSIFGSP